MTDGKWFLDALKDISEFATEEKIDGVLEGLAQVLEVYAVEAGVVGDQHNEILRILGTEGKPLTKSQNIDSQSSREPLVEDKLRTGFHS